MSYALSVILPSYLEEENLRLLLPRINSTLSKIAPQSYEIIVVDSKSPMDGTRLACEENNAIYLNREGENNYYGDAIRTGIRHAKGEHILFMDADGSHPPSFIENMYSEKTQADIVIASRYIKGGHTENSRHLILMSRLVNIGYAIVLGINCKDISNSFKMYKASLLKGLVLKCNNFDIIEEILYKIMRKNKALKLLEIPFTFKERMLGTTKRNLISFVFSYAITLLKLRFSA